MVMDGRLEDAIGLAARMRSLPDHAGAEGITTFFARLTDFRAWLYLARLWRLLSRQYGGFSCTTSCSAWCRRIWAGA